jgi:hypothetical protein
MIISRFRRAITVAPAVFGLVASLTIVGGLTPANAAAPGQRPAAGPAVPNAPDCKEGVSDEHVVAKYKFKEIGGGFAHGWLLCGDSKFGFRHIEASDNGKRISNYPGGWPGFDYSITAVERAWTSQKYNPKNDTHAFHKTIILCNRPAGWYRPINFRVVQARTNKRIITAVPAYGKKVNGDCPHGATVIH